MTYFVKNYDAIVLGAGHAGCEAALALARMGLGTLCLTMNLDSVALMACNPAIGGTSKGHLVREIDALGGEMGLATDDTYIQIRMLNTAKGPAVHSLRAQMDKRRYHERMKAALENQPNLELAQGECVRILTQNGHVSGIVTALGAQYGCSGLVIATGVYLKSRVLVGDVAQDAGPCGMRRAEGLSDALRDAGFTVRRFKTGTPPRVHRDSLDLDRMELQLGDVPTPTFSFMTGANTKPQYPCYLTYTNAYTHAIIRENIHRSAMYSGLITGTGTRYCPSIEDKITRFFDKERHQIFIEPEGLSTKEMYVQGMSTSLPADVQLAMLHTLRGLERAKLMREGYAIEYDCIDPTALSATLGARDIPGLYCAGQLNGSSGYEEAAAQGLYAGINCGLYLKGEPPLLLSRADAYIGVLVDDLATKGTNEPYRMMTSRAEYRLLLRQDNADLRLSELGRRTGLISDARYAKLDKKRENMAKLNAALGAYAPPDERLAALLAAHGEPAPKTGIRLNDLLKRRGVTYAELAAIFALPEAAAEAVEQVEISARYDGYIQKQREQVARFRELEDIALPELDYAAMGGLRIEARQKLAAQKPVSVGQAARISGVSPADIAVLLVQLKAMGVL